MNIRCFAVDDRDCLVRIGKRRALKLLAGQIDSESICTHSALRLVTVVSDNHLQPLLIFLMRVRLADGQPAIEALRVIRKALAATSCNSVVLRQSIARPFTTNVAALTEVLFQLSGWPTKDELRCSLAVALDVPASHLPEFRLGSPLLELIRPTAGSHRPPTLGS